VEDGDSARRLLAGRGGGACGPSSSGKFSHQNSRISSTVSRSPRRQRWVDSRDVADFRSSKSLPFPVAERSRPASQSTPQQKEGTYRVLATLVVGEESYRVFADMIVSAESAYLRLHRFDLPNGDDWFVERKFNIPVIQPDIVPLEKKLNDVEFILCFPVRLDETRAKAFFGRWGPPST
jgi:hypothetical protein